MKERGFKLSFGLKKLGMKSGRGRQCRSVRRMTSSSCSGLGVGVLMGKLQTKDSYLIYMFMSPPSSYTQASYIHTFRY